MLRYCILLITIVIVFSNDVFAQSNTLFDIRVSHKDSLKVLAKTDMLPPYNWKLTMDTINGDSIWECCYQNGMLKKSISYHPNSKPFVILKYSNGQLKVKSYVMNDDTSYKSPNWLPSLIYTSDVNYIYDYEGDYEWSFYKYIDNKQETYYIDGIYVFGLLFSIRIRNDSLKPLCEFRVDDIEDGWKIKVYTFNYKERKRNEYSDRVFLKSFFTKVYPQSRYKFQTKHHFYFNKGLIRCQNVYVIKNK